MRAYTLLGGAGEWSESVIIQYGEIVDRCTTDIPTDEPQPLSSSVSMMPQPSLINLPSFESSKDTTSSSSFSISTITITISVIAGVILLLVVGLISLACGRMYRQRRKLQYVLKRQVISYVHAVICYQVPCNHHFLLYITCHQLCTSQCYCYVLPSGLLLLL